MRIGVLGGGQLGRMLALAGPPLGLEVRCLERTADAPAAAVGPIAVGDPADADVVRAFAAGVDVLTYEIEGLPTGPLAALPQPVRPSVESLQVASDRWEEKRLFAALGIPAPRTVPAATPAALLAAVGGIGPCVVKTRRGGYDGRGQVVLPDGLDDDGYDAAVALLGHEPGVVVEELVAYAAEVSVLGARGVEGTLAVWPLVRNSHVGGVLHLSRVPAAVDQALEALAASYLTVLLQRLDHVGVLALELFVVGDRLLANEIAPRVHNSGHWTPEGAETGQFEQHLRAIAGLPLGSPALRGPAAMLNLLGTLPATADLLAVPGAHLQLYGKQPRPGRKLGHVTVTAVDEVQLEERLALLTAVVGERAMTGG